jgi:hypothetical protein
MFKELTKEAVKKSNVSISQPGQAEGLVEQKKAAPLQNVLSMPRPKALVRAIKDLDLLSDSDTEVKKRLEDMAKSDPPGTVLPGSDPGRTVPGGSPVSSVPEIGTDDFERKKKELLDSIRGTIERVMEHMPDELIGILAGCGLEGCYIHLIDKDGNILKHYANGEPLPGRLDTGYREMRKHGQMSHVEVYACHICVIDNCGQSKTLFI